MTRNTKESVNHRRSVHPVAPKYVDLVPWMVIACLTTVVLGLAGVFFLLAGAIDFTA